MAGLLVVGFLAIQLNTELPDAQEIKSIELKVPLRVYSAENLLISEFGNERRRPIDINDVPPLLIKAILAAEDDGFYEHQGIDFKGLFRAAISNFRSGHTRQGASTITMQVARNFFLSREKTYTRKIKEIFVAIRLEQTLSKDEILSLYINKIFLGHRAYGFGAAAEVYYGKPLQELNLAQIAMLAGLPKAPSSYNPLRNPEKALKRRNYVLGRLQELEYIDENSHQTAIDATITAQKHAKHSDLTAPYIAEMVRAQLTEQLGEGAYWQGLNVYTTIQAEKQLAASKSLRAGLQRYDRRHGFRGPVSRVDLAQLYESDHVKQNGIEQAYADLLNDYPNSQEQTPALVISSTEQTADVYTTDVGKVSLSLESSAWAKRHLSVNRLGPKPSSMQELLSPGDIVYIQPIAKTNKNKNNNAEGISSDTPEWQLSQLPAISGALISMDPNTGRVLSLIGGYDFFLNKYNRAIQSIRQPGSNIKPFIYSASLEKGFTPTSLISGAPIVIRDPSHGTLWRPENYSGKFYGPTRMREALGKSMNLVSIRLLRSIGIPYAREYTQRFGIDMARFSPTLTMALGAGGATPMDVLSAYAVLANGGYKVQPYFIETITDREGNIIYQAPQAVFCDECYAQYLPPPPQSEEDITAEFDDSKQLSEEIEQNTAINEVAENSATEEENNHTEEKPNEEATTLPQTYEAPRVMSHANNFLTVSMLKDVIRRGTARKAQSLKRDDLAGKTGTTNDYVDAWFSGFNSKVATTVWVGFDDPSSMGRGEAGSSTALPIWIDYMRKALNGVPEDGTTLPQYIEEASINRNTGRRTLESDPDAITEYFVLPEFVPQVGQSETELLLSELNSDLVPDNEFTDEAALDDIDYSTEARQDDALEPENTDSDNPNLELTDEEQLPEERIIGVKEDLEGLF